MADAMYVRIAEDLRTKIKAGKLRPGSQLPPEQRLQADYGKLFGLNGDVSRNTVRDAVEMLVREGRVEKRPGQGTFILKKEEPFLITLITQSGDAEGGKAPSYLSAVAKQGGQVESTPARVEIHPSSRAPELRLGDGEQVLSRHQQRSVDGRPHSLQTSFYPLEYARKAPRLLVAGDIEEGAVAYIAAELGIEQVGWGEVLQVRAADGQERDFFDLSAKSGAQVIEAFQTAFDGKGNPIRLTVTVYAADRVRLAYDAGVVPREALSGAAGAPAEASGGPPGDPTKAPR